MNSLGDQVQRLLGAGRDHDVVGVGGDALQRHDLEDLFSQLRSRPGRSRIAARWRRARGCTRSTVSATVSVGRAETKGIPPARETTSGREATENNARISEARQCPPCALCVCYRAKVE